MVRTSEPNSRREYWIGVARILTAVFGTFWSARAQIRSAELQVQATRAEIRKARISDALMQITGAVLAVTTALQSHSSEYVEIQNCLTTGAQPVDCWTKPAEYRESSAAAWNALDVQLTSARLFLKDAGGANQLQLIESIKDQHQRDFPTVRVPRTAAEADKAIALMEKTRADLETAIKMLAMDVASHDDGK